jgi:hypothetical protein
MPTFESSVQRESSGNPVRLAWIDKLGQARCVPGRCIDISRRRMHVEVPEQIPLHTPVMIRANGLSMAGAASVKYVTYSGDTRFILLLEVG